MSNTNITPNKKTAIYIAIAVVVLIAVAGAVYYFSTTNMPAPEMTKTDDSAMMQTGETTKPTDSMTDKTVMVGGAAMFANKDIVSNISTAPNLTTLVSAVTAADLVTTLQGPGPFTVFGPDNDAFAKLPAGTVESLVKPENKANLAAILTYHVVPGKLAIADLRDGQVLKTVAGGNLAVSKTGNTAMINGAKILTPDVFQSNGVVHVIDTVLMPTESTTTVGGAAMFGNKDIVSNIVNAPNLTTLVAAVTAADLVTTLQGPGPFTVFGPDNDAFAKLPAGTVESLVKPENKAALAKILTYHVVSGRYLAQDLKDGQILKTVQGENLTVMKSGAAVMIKDASGNTAKITTADVVQSNGVAHVIDTVMMPKK